MKPSTEYELFVRDIIQALVDAQGLETVTVEHNEPVQGLSRSHQVDVYWEYRLGGVLHRIIINCKRYADTVEVTDVMTLSGVLQDLPGVRGLIVTTRGFQSGALSYAKTHGIGLKVIRAPEDQDWDGRIRAFEGTVELWIPEMIGVRINLNRDWIASNVTDNPESLAGKFTSSASETVVRDLATGAVDDMNELWNRAIRENPYEAREETEERCGVLRWDDARYERPGHPSVRVDNIEFRWRLRQGESMKISHRAEPAAIVRDAIEGTLLFVDPDGRISGDVEAELGIKRGSRPR